MHSDLFILYIHSVGAFGGSSRSLFEMTRKFSASQVQPLLVCPGGQVADIFAGEGVPSITCKGVTKFDNTLFSYYRGFRWLILLRELAYMPSTYLALRQARQRWNRVDVVHINDLNAIPAAIVARHFFQVPLVMHVRSMQRSMEIGLRGKLLRWLIGRYVDQLVAIDHTVKDTLPSGLTVEVVHNGFPSPASDRKASATNVARTFSVNAPLRIACVGGLLRLKGVYDLVEAARICKQDGLHVEFVLAGENPRKLTGLRGYLLKLFGFSEDTYQDVSNLIEFHQLHSEVKLVGFTRDIKTFFESVDLLCFPSHLNACGRPVFEAAFSRVPSIVALENPKEDTIIDGETGICIPAMNPGAIAKAIAHFYENPAELDRMGDAAFGLAVKNFDAEVNARKMLAIYQRLAGKAASPAPLPSR